MGTAIKWVVVIIAAVAFVGLAHAQSLESKNRQELKRADLTGTNMEVILSTTEYQPGDFLPRHIHHGEEAFYVLQGAMVETPVQTDNACDRDGLHKHSQRSTRWN